jgi:anti-anti-sigma factor
MIGGVPVVTAPAEIDMTTSGELRAILLEWHSRGHTAVVVDMSGTAFCDSAGLRELTRAHQRAVVDGGGLYLVMAADGAVVRTFTMTGLGNFIPHFATLKQALGQVPAIPVRRLRRGTARQPLAAPDGPTARVRDGDGLVADGRSCEQCGAAFMPVREHARFCANDCRIAWNRDHLGDSAVEVTALTWSVAAMSEAAARLPGVKVQDRLQALAAIGEAVWWVTLVDATLVRHHLKAYDTVMAEHTLAERRLINEILSGLRFARNWMSRAAGLGEIIETGKDAGHITGWTWNAVPESALSWLPSRTQVWERARYRAYQARLADHTIGQTFAQVLPFLEVTGAGAASSTDAGQYGSGNGCYAGA